MKKTLIGVAGLPGLAMAHDGHGVFDAANLLHYFAEPMHSVPFALLFAVAAYAFIRRRE